MWYSNVLRTKVFNKATVARNTARAFTLIELLVVIAIIGVLSSVVLASLNTARARARDSQRQSDIQAVNKAIQLYWLEHNAYPSTGSLDTVYMDPGCVTVTAPDQITANWVPYVVSEGFISVLPKDPRGGYDTARNIQNADTCYMYSSDGTSYILTAWGTVETNLVTSGGLYSRAGYREQNYNKLDAKYYCNNAGIGGSGGDYYQHSYTISNVNCTW